MFRLMSPEEVKHQEGLNSEGFVKKP